jgi:hypothetical protein
MQQGNVTKGCGDGGGWPRRRGRGLHGAEHAFGVKKKAGGGGG